MAAIAMFGASSAPAQVRVRSGTPQLAFAYASSHSVQFEVKFNQPLVVAVTGKVTKIRYRCISHGCTFLPTDQGEDVERVDESAYDVKVDGGKTTIEVTVGMPSVESVIVEARPASGGGKAVVRFVLTAQ